MRDKVDLKALQDALTVIGSYAMQTDRRDENKNECAKNCKPLKRFQEGAK